jgi:hypothetical protein
MLFERILIAVGPDDRGDIDSLVDTAVELAESMESEVYFLYHHPSLAKEGTAVQQ